MRETRTNRAEDTAEEADEKTRLSEWKHLLRKDPDFLVRDETLALAELWSGASDVLDGESRECHQRLAKDLVDDKYFGCSYIIMTLGTKGQYLGKLTMQVIDNFLCTITHPAILDCLSIDTYVGTMYNLISGVNGMRAILFFANLCLGLKKGCLEGSEECSAPKLDLRLQAILVAMRELLHRERRVSLNSDVPDLLRQMEDIFVLLDAAAAKTAYVCHATKDQVEVLRRVVNLTTNILKNPDDNGGGDGDRFQRTNALMTTGRLVYPIDIVLPGGRHDNDHRDIAQINTIPTADEILSSQLDYLPSTDFRQPHFHNNIVQRYLDTHFRLLRHDIFGPLKEALSTIMSSFAAGTPPSRLVGRNMNAHLYQNATIAHIAVHEKRGFEARITFTRPPRLHQLSTAEQCRWWDNSKRLERGGLVCLICLVGTEMVPLLLLVSDKCTDPSQDSTLVSGSRPPTISVRLASRTLGGLRRLVQAYHEKARGVLVDLPGVIPSTFTPILENLQKMIGVGDLPFQKWIIPDLSNSHPGAATPAPPRYARGAGFSFCLDSIAADSSTPLSLSATASPDDPVVIDELEARTNLDRGQCQALVAALTREFAQIQGPPGTGKSFLGVKLITALLSCKKTVGLGPIIIM